MSSSESKSPAETGIDSIAQLNDWVDRITARRPAARSSSVNPGASPVRVSLLVPETRAKHLKRLTELCRGASIGQADILADTLMLLTEGVRNDGNATEAARRKLNRICKATIAAFSR